MKKTLLLAVAVLAFPMVAGAVGIVGDCVDCHTMHNSQQGQPVARKGLNDTITTTPIQNLLRLDCVACHAAGGSAKIVDLGGGSQVPQVMHTGTDDLAGGNFNYILGTDGNRKGHNVVDLVSAEPYVGMQPFAVPPGKYAAATHSTDLTTTGEAGGIFGTSGGGFNKLTCAGHSGCHGTRNQTASYSTLANGSVNTATISRLTGIPAISGAHHASFDGLKNPAQILKGKSNGVEVAQGYRFIPGLKGVGNTNERWQNTSATSHNEYFGTPAKLAGSSCGVCHINATTEAKSHLGSDSKIQVPNQSMSGFCTTCHGSFHSVGAAGNTLESNSSDYNVGGTQGQGPNGISGAFLRHPSDYVIPNSGEYQYYTAYNLTAPVARQVITGFDGSNASGTVTPGSDMVMCLSCHMAHASANNYMLRFEYEDADGTGNGTTMMKAGNSSSTDGCLACHTTKGVAKDASSAGAKP